MAEASHAEEAVCLREEVQHKFAFFAACNRELGIQRYNIRVAVTFVLAHFLPTRQVTNPPRVVTSSSTSDFGAWLITALTLIVTGSWREACACLI